MTNETAYKFGVEIGRFLRFLIVMAVIVFVIGAAYGNGKKAGNDSQPKIEKVIKHKVKHKKHKRQNKKCVCECKKVVDTPEKIITVENIEKQLNATIGPRD